MKRVLIAGDSLSMTRHADGLSYEQIYPVRTQLDCPRDIVVNGSLRANSSREIVSESYLTEYLRPLRPDHVVLQLGIVDCAPRVFKPRERLVLSIMARTPGLRGMAKAMIYAASRHRYTLTRQRQLCTVDPESFECHLRSFVAAARSVNAECAFTFVNIPRPRSFFLDRNYRAAEIIDQYNGIIERLARDLSTVVIDLHLFTGQNLSSLLSDGYHLAAHAHEFIHRELMRRLRQLPETK